MPEFLVTMDITFPRAMPADKRREVLGWESQAAGPFLRSGELARAWRTYGEHEGNHGHMALWDEDSEDDIRAAYATFPLVQLGFTANLKILPLQVNPNDPQAPADAPFPLTYANLRRFLGRHGEPSRIANEGLTAALTGDVTIHDHPVSGRPREIHFMVGGQKVAEIGPADAQPGEDVTPSYIDLLAEWEGKPVAHQAWKQRILADNGLIHPTYADARSAARVRHQ